MAVQTGGGDTNGDMVCRGRVAGLTAAKYFIVVDGNRRNPAGGGMAGVAHIGAADMCARLAGVT